MITNPGYLASTGLGFSYIAPAGHGNYRTSSITGCSRGTNQWLAMATISVCWSYDAMLEKFVDVWWSLRMQMTDMESHWVFLLSLSTMSLWTVAALNSTRNLQGPCDITFGVSSDWFLIISSPFILKWSVKHIIKPMFDSHGPWQMSTLDPRPRIGSIGSSPIRSFFLGILVNEHWSSAALFSSRWGIFVEICQNLSLVFSRISSEPGWCAVSILDMEEWWRIHTS